MSSQAELFETYSNMSDGELLELAVNRTSLECPARQLLDNELKRRGLREEDVLSLHEELNARRRKEERARRKRIYRFW